ncbi:MAG: aminoacetone oxidase family FAD-binding enzyme [Bacteroidales bacterium]|nr:aminoacetone oxidase family FAD-binding enzyme [Bacteroidales bacterium]
MKSEIVVIGGGASGLMAAYSAARYLREQGSDAMITVLEKMPRPARKVMITGKGRCNFTNLKEWNDFCPHIRNGAHFVKNAFYNLPSSKVIDFFEENGMKTVVERGDRAFPRSYHASEVVDTLVNACNGLGVRIECDAPVDDVEVKNGRFCISLADGRNYLSDSLIVATGGLSYPSTGSTGDGFRWARQCGHKVTPTFPSLTALVPRGYKEGTGHIDRSTPLTEAGEKLCGIQLKNIGLALEVEGTVVESEFGDIDFTDGGIEGPLGFQLSRKAVKTLINGSRVALILDMKPGVELSELTARVKELWTSIDHDPRSRGVREKEKCRILLGKFMPWELIPAFSALNPQIMTLERKGRADTKLWINLVSIAKALKEWRFDIAGYVGYERAVVTAGGVSLDELVSKTMSSRLVEGLYFCGEILDVDCDTGGYNLQSAFCTGALAGQSAAKAFMGKLK